jgi:hypothetical protein
MCFSYKVSRFNLIVNTVTSLLLFTLSKSKEYKVLALFFLYTGLVQLYDMIFWKNNEKNQVNYVTSKIAFVSISLQPIILALLISHYLDLKKESKILLITYFIVMSMYTMYAWNKFDYTITDESETLKWRWFTNYAEIPYLLYLSSFAILALQNFHSPLNKIFLGLGTITFIMGLNKVHYLGKLWCGYSCYIPLGLLLCNYLGV